MAKIAFTKLGLTKRQDVVNLEFNNQSIEVKTYLPIQEKLELISSVINNAHDDNNFSNPVKLDMFTCLEIIKRYTNISFTEKQSEDSCKLYDLLESNGLFKAVIGVIPSDEYNFIVDSIDESVSAIYTYQNSVMGILENVSNDYSNLNLDATELQKKMADPNTVGLLKEIIPLIGLK